MKNKITLDLPIKASREMAMAIIEQLPGDEFRKVTEDIKDAAGKRGFAALERMRLSAKRNGLKKKDLQNALKEARAKKENKKASYST